MDECCEMRKNQKYILEHEVRCDVTFRVGEKGDLIKAHKLILAQRSPVFNGMFYGPLAEKTSPIVIPDVKPDVFKALLRYCYYDFLDMTHEQALQTIYAAKKYLLPVLEDACCKILTETLGPENIWVVLNSCIDDLDDGLLKDCDEFFNNDAKQVEAAFNSRHFLSIRKETLLHLLKLNDMEESRESRKYYILISEIKLFMALNAWAKSECERNGIQASGPMKRKALGDCLQLIRFPTMMIKDIVNIVFPTDILTQAEKYSLLVYEYADEKNQPSLSFSSEAHMFMLEVDNLHSTDQIEEYSPFQKREVEYSVYEIFPRQRLGFSGVDVFAGVSEEELPTAALHEIIVIKNGKEKVVCNVVMSKVLGGDPESHLLEFDEICLDAFATYLIKVEMRTDTGGDEDDFCWDKEWYYDRLSSYQLDMDITNREGNEKIWGLRLRLL